MFASVLSEEGDAAWETIRIAHGEALPDPSKYHGIVITGSRFSVRDGSTLPWYNGLCELIRFANKQGSPRIYGGCFGCQVIADALGGHVDYNPGRNFILRSETIVPTSAAQMASHFPGFNDDYSSMSVIVSHGDCVCTLPPGAVLLASSESCANELYIVRGEGKHVKNHNILAAQSHPEFDYDYCIRDRIWPAVCARKRLTEEEQAECAKTFVGWDRNWGADRLCALIKFHLHMDHGGEKTGMEVENC
jgi:GMP synthase-like glutamine amidotransferase